MSIDNHVPDGTFVNAVAKLATPEYKLLDLPLGQKLLVGYANETVYGEPQLPEPKPLSLCTLTGLVDAYKNKVYDDDQVFIEISSYDEVRIVSKLKGKFQQRFCYVRSSAQTPRFDYGYFFDLDLFILNMQTNFENTDERKRALDFVGALTAGLAKDIIDDGTTQQVTVRQGVTRAGNTAFLNPVRLAPFRTFSEIEQPTSPFVLRTQQKNVSEGNLTATAALFEADGGAWRTEAIQSIGRWLRDKLPDAVILA